MKIKSLSSKELRIIQDILDAHVAQVLSEPDTDYIALAKTLKVIYKIDNNKRVKWRKEKFGVYEEIADEALKMQPPFNPDYRPF